MFVFIVFLLCWWNSETPAPGVAWHVPKEMQVLVPTISVLSEKYQTADAAITAITNRWETLELSFFNWQVGGEGSDAGQGRIIFIKISFNLTISSLVQDYRYYEEIKQWDDARAFFLNSKIY